MSSKPFFPGSVKSIRSAGYTPVIFLILMSLLLTGSITQLSDLSKAKVEGGLIEGYTKDGVAIFKGIPFAAPPVGNLRWRPPRDVQPWTGSLKCLTAPPSAMQNKPSPFFCWTKEFLAPGEPLSEDCLYLNVWTAAKEKCEKRPVIVWIHGGAFTGGSGTVPLYDGTEMAKKGVVFVTINYRLGVFGFFAHPDLSAESSNKVSGNYGILDQIAALEWVKKNIQNFGGDPGNVTIAGQSAGAFSVNALMTTPLARNLFHRAIAESGGMFGTQRSLVQNLSDAEASGKKLADKLGAKSADELRSRSAQDLMSVPGMWGLVADNYVILPASEIFAAGKQNDVPLLTGWNSDDGVSFGQPVTAEAFRANAAKNYGDKAAEFLELFPAGNEDEAKQSQKLVSQLFFGWQNYFWAKMQSSKGKSGSYLYYFSHVPPGQPDYGAFHSAEFGYALKTLKLWNRPFVKKDYDLSEIMSSYWVNFAKNGNPNGNGLPAWPAFSSESNKVIEFGNEVRVMTVPYIKQLEFISRINN